MLAPHVWPITEQTTRIQKMLNMIHQKQCVCCFLFFFVLSLFSLHFCFVPGSQPAVWENHGSWHRRAPSPASGPWRRGAGDGEGLQQVRTVIDRWRNNRCTMDLIQTNSGAPCKQSHTCESWGALNKWMNTILKLKSDQSRKHTHTHTDTWSCPHA